MPKNCMSMHMNFFLTDEILFAAEIDLRRVLATSCTIRTIH